MRRPARSDFVFGHRLWQIFTVCAAVFLSAAWATQQQRGESIPWLLPAIALLFCKTSFAARARIVAYREWRAAWDEMAGSAPEPKAQRQAAPKANRLARVLFAGTTWALLLGWLSAHTNDPVTPAYQAGAFGFAGLTLWGLGGAAWSVVRWAFSPNRPRAAAHERNTKADPFVAVCPSVPWNSPGVREFTAALPDYCQALLRRGPSTSLP